MSKHDDDTCPHLVIRTLLEAEKRYTEQVRVENSILMNRTARLMDEVERLKEGNDCLGQMHDKEMERSAYLLEEFNRTTAWGRGLESDLSHARVEISFLKAEVERLTKHGDAMAETLESAGFDSAMDFWNAAKEGKPSV